MKYCIIVPDGAADYVVPRLEKRTPLQAARTPNMDRAASEGMLGQACHVPKRMTAGSSVAMMSVVGYNPAIEFTGRAPLEAADMGLELARGQWAVRCNLITRNIDSIADFTAGHISTAESALLIAALNETFADEPVSFHVGTGYRHIMLYDGPEALTIDTTPPHDIVGEPVKRYLPKGPAGQVLQDLMDRATPVLERHDVNSVRVDLGSNPANAIWLWGQGVKPTLEPFAERFGIRGAAISAVNLVRGIAKLIQWDTILVPGATAYTDTDYAAKGRYAADALAEYDLVLVHIEAPDEASHEMDVMAKIRAIESIDAEIVGPVMALADTTDMDLRVLIEPDHITSIADGRHKRDPVPFAMWGAGIGARSGRPYNELTASRTEISFPDGHQLMANFLGHPGA